MLTGHGCATMNGGADRRGLRWREALGLVLLAAFARALVLFALLVATLSLGIVDAQAQLLPAPEAPAETSESDRTIGRFAANDEAIAGRIREIFREIDGMGRVLVRVEAGVVTLTGEVADAAQIEAATALADRVEGVVTVRSTIEEATDVDERLRTVAERFQTRMWQVLAKLPLILVALLTFALVIFVGRWLSRRRWPFEAIAPNAFIATLLRQVLLIAFVVAGLVLALDILNATALLSTVIGAAGIVGLAVGFAVRDTVENYVASILLSLRQPFRPNDFVCIDNHMGSVAKLTSRATVLLTPEGNHLRIPNSTVFKAVITNFTLNPTRRFQFELGVDADSDLGEAVDLGLRVLNGLEYTLEDPDAQAWIERIGDSNVIVFYAAWIDQRVTSYPKAKGEAMRLVKLALEDAGFSLPEPIYRLRFDGAPQVVASIKRSAEEPERATPVPHEGESREAGDVTPDKQIERQVEHDRAAEDGGRDLLDERAPSEI